MPWTTLTYPGSHGYSNNNTPRKAAWYQHHQQRTPQHHQHRLVRHIITKTTTHYQCGAGRNTQAVHVFLALKHIVAHPRVLMDCSFLLHSSFPLPSVSFPCIPTPIIIRKVGNLAGITLGEEIEGDGRWGQGNRITEMMR